MSSGAEYRISPSCPACASIPTITACPTQYPPTLSASWRDSLGVVTSTSTPAVWPHPHEPHLASERRIAASSWAWTPYRCLLVPGGMRCRRPWRGYSFSTAGTGGTSLATRMGRSSPWQSLAPTDRVAVLGSLGRVQSLVFLRVSKLQQPLSAEADLVDQPGASRLGASEAGHQLDKFVPVGAAELVGGYAEPASVMPVGMGRADLLVSSAP